MSIQLQSLVSTGAHFEMVDAGQQLLSQQLAISAKDVSTIQKGIALYFDPTKNEAAAAWLKANQKTITDITHIAHAAVKVEAGIKAVHDEIEAVTGSLKDVEAERSSVQAELNQENETFGAQRTQLSSQLDTAKDDLAQESALLRNPLSSSVGRAAVKVGKYALAATVPTVAWAQQKLIEENCANAMSGPISAFNCASTATHPSIYMPVAAATGVTLACGHAVQAAERIIAKEKEAQRLKDELAAQEKAHQDKVDGFGQRTQELSEQVKKSTEALESAQKSRESLDMTRKDLLSQVAGLRQEKMREIARTQLNLLEEAINEPAQNKFVANAGAAAVQTILNSVVVAYADQSNQPQAISVAGSANQSLAIEEL